MINKRSIGKSIIAAGCLVLSTVGCVTINLMSLTGNDNRPKSSQEDELSKREPAVAGSRSVPSATAAWGPLVHLRAGHEAYRNYPKGMMRPEPSTDGWWVTPIHANVLASGDVLITGWARVQEKQCADHAGRQWPASFVLRINPGSPVPEQTQGSQIYIQTIDEKPEFVGTAKPKDPVDVLYCAGHVPLPDGRVFFTGGARYLGLEFGGFDPGGTYEDEYGLDYSRIYDPATSSFTRLEARFPLGPTGQELQRLAGKTNPQTAARDWTTGYKKGMMWYPTNLRLPGGRVLVIGGFARQSGPFDPQFVNRGVAIFDSKTNSWQSWIDHKEKLSDKPDATDVLNLAGFDYVHTFLLPKPVVVSNMPYHVAVLGGTNDQYGLISLDQALAPSKRIVIPQTGEGVGPARPLGRDGKPPGSSDTTGLILPSGEIVMVGGGREGGEGPQRIDVYNPYTNKWRKPVYTGISRIRAASVLLPNGNVLILNGEESYYPNTNIGDRRRPLIFEPSTGEVKVLEPWPDDEDTRGYHNFAVLLKDGRILLGGGREQKKAAETGREEARIGCERPDLRIYSPPYLSQGPRPVISSSESQPIRMKVKGSAVELAFEGPALKTSGGVVLMALGAQTHHFDQNQRMVILKYERTSKGVRITPPSTEWEAPIGQYNLFLVSDQGVPSQGVSVQLEAK